jgi:putative transposase
VSGHRPLTGSDVAVTCRVLMVNPQPYYRWFASPVTDAELAQAYLANALSGQRPLC